MAEPFNRAAMRNAQRRLLAVPERGMREAVTAVALATERQAKINASVGAHRKGTKTPATRYSTGPARISGNLLRNVTHQPVVRSGTVYSTRVGVARGAPYGKWVEALGYEFMAPSAHYAETVLVPIAVVALRRGIATTR